MNVWLFSLGLVAVAATVIWYARLLNQWTPDLHVPPMSKGDVPTTTAYVWLLTMMLSQSVVINSFDLPPNGVALVGSIAVALVVSDLVRRWHNRGIPPTAPEPPAAWFPDSDGDAPGGH